MATERSVPLELATNEQLMLELGRRCVAFLLARIEKSENGKDGEHIRFSFRGGSINALGLAVAAEKYVLNVLEGREDDEEEGDG